VGYTLGAAAKAAGRTKPTILRAIQAGRLSAAKDEATGAWSIEPAELHRLYPPASQGEGEPARETHQGNDALHLEVTLLRTQIADKNNVIDDLRRRLDDESAERRRLTLLLTDQRGAGDAAALRAELDRRRGWGLLRRLRGGK
jgi:hypothetical protein